MPSVIGFVFRFYCHGFPVLSALNVKLQNIRAYKIANYIVKPTK